MNGGFTAGGLITGLDTNSLIQQLMQIERQPLIRLQNKIGALKTEQDSISSLRTQLTTLRGTLQDFRFGVDFNQYAVESSSEAVATATPSGPNPTTGAFTIDVTQLASATVATSSGSIGAAINPGAAFASSGVNGEVTNGTFSINGTQFNFDFTASSLNDAINAINGAGLGVTASYDGLTDKVTIQNSTPGDTSIINFGGTGDTSNFLDIINVESAVQLTNGGGSTEVTSSVGLGSLNEGTTLNAQNYAGGAISGGTFFVNGVGITIDPTTDSLSDVLTRINNSDAGVTASYDPTTDGIRVVSDSLGSRTVSFVSGTSNFLDVANLTSATQTAGLDAQFSVNGGPVLTRNTNDVTDAVGDLTLNLKSIGTTTLTVSQDQDAVVGVIQDFVDKFNEAVTAVAEAVSKDGDLENDSTIRSINNFLTQTIFESVPGLPGGLQNLLEIGISSGADFSASAVFQLEIDEDALRNAITTNVGNVEGLFANDADTGIADLLFTYLDEITGTSGFLNDRSRSNGTIDRQIDSLNDRIARAEDRLVLKEARLRASFIRMEQFASDFQAAGSSLGALGQGFGGF